MIAYRLICSSGHEFDGWFSDSAGFEAQSKNRVLECPFCGDAKVQKAIMAPALVKGGARPAAEDTPSIPAPAPQQPAEMQKLRQFMAGYRKFIEAHSEYVGPRFPEEARKIHYGETEERPIYGESSVAEARELIEEGIAIAPVPPDPSDLN